MKWINAIGSEGQHCLVNPEHIELININTDGALDLLFVSKRTFTVPKDKAADVWRALGRSADGDEMISLR